jgi:hypothetical protein
VLRRGNTLFLARIALIAGEQETAAATIDYVVVHTASKVSPAGAQVIDSSPTLPHMFAIISPESK